LKQFSIVLFVLLLFVPPVQAHVDAIIFTNTIENHHTNTLNDHHEEEHHKNDTEDHKNSKHHQHCTSLGFSSAIISPLDTCCNLIGITEVKKTLHFYQKPFVSSYLDTLIEPPQV
jgi:ABC-type Zn2+ transport system substrate-binding protein/surface adhesin